MKKFLSLCLCFAMALGVLSGCSASGADMSKASDKSISGSIRDMAKPVTDEIKGVADKVKVEKPVEDPDAVQRSYLERAKDTFINVHRKDENTLFSPTSLEMALGLLSEGAGGTTKDQLLAYLGVDDYSEVAKAMMEYADSVTDEEETIDEDGFEAILFGGYHNVLELANSLWVKEGYTLKSDFLSVAQDMYSATAQNADFSDAEGLCTKVNEWCSEKTHGLINKILDPDMITPELALILCNSLYFESSWWEPWQVYEGQFTNSDGTVVEVPDFLHDMVNTYYETENATAFAKSYNNGSTFIGILPSEGVELADIDLDALLASKTQDYDVRVSMPKLNYEFTADNLMTVLEQAGVSDVFIPGKADLTGLVNESKELFVSKILQKCKIELDENGTKAAAVTAVMAADNAVMMEEPEYKDVHLTRPFYYMIINEEVNQVLFIGAVNSVDFSVPSV